MKKFVWLLFGLLLMVSSCMSTKQYETDSYKDIVKVNTTYTIKYFKTLEDTQGFEWKDVLKKYYSSKISNNTYAWYKNNISYEKIATLNKKDGIWKLTITNYYPKEMTGYLIDFKDHSIKYGTYDYYAIKKDLKIFYTLVYDLRGSLSILTIDYGKLHSYNETNLEEKIKKDLTSLSKTFSYYKRNSYYLSNGYSYKDSDRLAREEEKKYKLDNWKSEFFYLDMNKDKEKSYSGYVINFGKYTISPVVLKIDEPINGRFYFQTENGVFSATYEGKWKIEKSDKSLKDYILSHISWRCEYKDPEKEYEKWYNEYLDFFKDEEFAARCAKSDMDRTIENNKEVPYWIEVQNKILEFFEETN